VTSPGDAIGRPTLLTEARATHARSRAAQFSSVVVAVFFSVSASVFVFCFVFLSKVKKFRVRSDNFIAIDRRLTVVVTDCPVK